jgi:hypothetical protein
MSSTLTICIGYDRKEPLTLAVLTHSLIRHASRPVRIIPVALDHLRDVYTRNDPAGTTEFSLSRFLTPWLCNYEGIGVFMDCDMVCLTDIHHVLTVAKDYPVSVCQHAYTPKAGQKATGQQVTYPRKNWSSFMVFDAARCRMLTPAFVSAATPAELHRLAWVPDTHIGSLPLEWNWLVGEYPDNPATKVLHYTLGAPCFPGYADSPMAAPWWEAYRSMLVPMKTYQMPEAEVYAQQVRR